MNPSAGRFEGRLQIILNQSALLSEGEVVTSIYLIVLNQSALLSEGEVVASVYLWDESFGGLVRRTIADIFESALSSDGEAISPSVYV
jgi:hypothetical protein